MFVTIVKLYIVQSCHIEDFPRARGTELIRFPQLIVQNWLRPQTEGVHFTRGGFPLPGRIEQLLLSIDTKALKGLRAGFKSLGTEVIAKKVDSVFQECLRRARDVLKARQDDFARFLLLSTESRMREDADVCVRLVTQFVFDSPDVYDSIAIGAKVFDYTWHDDEIPKETSSALRERGIKCLRRTCELAAEICWQLVLVDKVELLITHRDLLLGHRKYHEEEEDQDD